MRAYAGLATVPWREHLLPAVLERLVPQVDAVFVYLNGRSDIPRSCRGPSVIAGVEPLGDLGDAGKFWPLRFVDAGDVVLTVDDDILYPPDYLARMVGELERAGGVACVHGSRFREVPVRRYLQGRRIFGFEASLPTPMRVHVAGTGTAAFRAGDVALEWPFPTGDAADLYLSIACERQGVPRTAVPRRAGWLRQLEGAGAALSDELDSEYGRRMSELANEVAWSRL